MISTDDVKADVKQQKMKELIGLSCIFYVNYLQKLKYNVPSGTYFSFQFAWGSSHPAWSCPLKTGG